jgi:hypothetical protein
LDVVEEQNEDAKTWSTSQMEMVEAVMACWNQQQITKIVPLLALVVAPMPMGWRQRAQQRHNHEHLPR